MRYAFLPLCLLALPALAQLPPSPPGVSSIKLLSPKHAEHVASLGKAMVKTVEALPAGITAPVGTITLAWYYPADQLTNIVFEVWAATDLTAASSSVLMTYDAVPIGFTMIATTGETNIVIQTNLPAQFFIVRARSIATGIYSYWNQASSSVPGPLLHVDMVSPTNGQTVSGTITLEARVTQLFAPGNVIIASHGGP